MDPEDKLESAVESNGLDAIQSGQKTLSHLSVALFGLLILAIFYTIFLTKAILLPITLCIILNFLLAPVVRYLKNFYIPEQISALLLIIIIIGFVTLGVYYTKDPAKNWLAKSPEMVSASLIKISHFFNPVLHHFKSLSIISNHVQTPAENGSTEVKNIVTAVSANQSTIIAWVFSSTSQFFVDLTVVTLLLYFLLASKDFFLRKAVEVLPHLKEKKR